MRVLIYSPRRLYGESLGASLEQTDCVAAVFVEHDWSCVARQAEENAADIVLADVAGNPAASPLLQLDEAPIGVPVVALVTAQPLSGSLDQLPEVSAHVLHNADAVNITATMRASLMQVTAGEAMIGNQLVIQDRPKTKIAKKNGRHFLILWVAVTALALGLYLIIKPAV